MSDQNNPTRLLPVRPNLDQLKHQAKDLLRNIRTRRSSKRSLSSISFIQSRNQRRDQTRGRAVRARTQLRRTKLAAPGPSLQTDRRHLARRSRSRAQSSS